MSERLHGHGAEPAPTPALARLRELVAGGPPALPRPRPLRLEGVRRSWAGAAWHARTSVRAGVPLDDFLRARLARYLGALRVPRARLPLAIEVEDGEIAARPRPEGAPETAGDGGWLAPLAAIDGPAVRQEVAELESRLALLDGELEAARRRRDDVTRRLAADVAAGLVAAPPAVDATAEQMGRPPVRSAAPRALLVAFAAAAIAAETWQVALPLLASVDVTAARLGAEALRRPAEVAFAALFALGVSASLFALARGGLDAAAALFQGEPDPRRRGGLRAAALAAFGLAALVALAIAALPSPSPAIPPASLVLLLLAVPIATALLLRTAAREQERREAERAAALDWDRERARALADRGRRLEEVAWAEEEALRLERQRDASRRRLREVSLRAVAAARLATDAEREERAALARVAQSLVGALELDRYEFVRQASARGVPELVAPRRRRLDGRAAAGLEPAAPDAAVEAGRLAS